MTVEKGKPGRKEFEAEEVPPSHVSIGKVSVRQSDISPDTQTVDLGTHAGTSPQPIDDPPPPGDQQFLLRACINVGGCGEIWEAIQTSLQRVVAVKRVYLADEEATSSASEDRKREEEWLHWQFRQEALITAQLDHPNVLPVYDLGVDASGTPVLAMKLVRGTPWHQLMRHDLEVLSYDDYLDRHLPTLIEVARAVAFAHSRQIVHRDLKPSQVMVGEFGEVLLMDWGLAVYVGAADDPRLPDGLSEQLATPLTAASPAGTPALMAPEQTRETAETITPRTDIYQLGGTLYFLLTGTYPHEAPTADEAMEQARRGLVDPPEVRNPELSVPPELGELAMRALAISPIERPQNADIFIQTIQTFLKLAANRRTSRKFVKEARAVLEEVEEIPEKTIGRRSSQGSVAIYEHYSEGLSLLDRARGIWFLNPDIPPLETKLLTGYGKAALAQGDYTLARLMVDRLHDPTMVAQLRREIDDREALERRHASQRRVAIASAIVLTAILLVVTGVYSMVQLETNRLLSTERENSLEMVRQRAEAEQIALRERAIADAARERAEELQLIAEQAQGHAEQQYYYASIGYAASSVEQGRVELARRILYEDTLPELRGWEWGFLLNRLHPEMMALRNEDQIFHAEYSPDGSLIATGDLNHIALWDAETGRRIWKTRTNDRLVWSVAFSPDGSRLAGVSFDQRLVVLDAETGEEIEQIVAHYALMRDVAYSPDGTIIATTGADYTLRLWDAETLESVAVLEDHRHTVYSVSFNFDGTRMVTTSLDGRTVIRDGRTGEPIHDFPSGGSTSLSAAFSDDGSKVVAATSNGTLRIFDVESGDLIRQFQSPEPYIHNVEFLPGGEEVVVVDDSGFVRIFDLEAGSQAFAYMADDPTWKVRVHPDGDRLLTTSRRSVRVTSLSHARGTVPLNPEATLEDVIPAHRFAVYGLPEQRHLDWQERDRAWDSSTGWSYATAGQNRVAVESRFAHLSPDGRFQARIDRDSLTGAVTDAVSGDVLYTPDFSDLLTLAISPDSSIVAYAAIIDIVELINTETWEPIVRLDLSQVESHLSAAGGTSLNDLAFSPDGALLAIGCLGGLVLVYDIERDEFIHKFGDVPGIGISVAFSPDGAFLASGSTNDDVTMWNVETGEEVVQFLGHQRTIYHVEFSPDGRRLVTASSDLTSKLWDTATGQELLTLHDGRGNRQRQPLAASFSPDGLMVFIPLVEGELLALEAFPWHNEDYPGDDSFALEDRVELFKRQSRISPDITVEDVAITPAQ